MAQIDDDLGTLDDLIDGGFEALARAVRSLAEAAKRVEEAGLNRRALVLLLADASGLGKRDVDKLLDALGSLEERFLIPDE